MTKAYLANLLERFMVLVRRTFAWLGQHLIISLLVAATVAIVLGFIPYLVRLLYRQSLKDAVDPTHFLALVAILFAFLQQLAMANAIREKLNTLDFETRFHAAYRDDLKNDWTVIYAAVLLIGYFLVFAVATLFPSKFEIPLYLLVLIVLILVHVYNWISDWPTVSRGKFDQFYYLYKHGSGCISYSTINYFQPDMECFGQSGVGYISYLRFQHDIFAPHGCRLALADPICAEESYGDVLAEFCRDETPTIFLQVARPTAQHLAARFAVARFGYETQVDLKEFNRADHEALNTICTDAENAEPWISEQPWNTCCFAELQHVSEMWLKTKDVCEYVLLTRPLLDVAQPGVRCCIARHNGKVTAFVTFDPMYRSGKVVGYYQNMVRYLPESPKGTTELLTVHAMAKFAREGITMVSLGISPLADVVGSDNDDGIPLNQALATVLNKIFEKGKFAYPFKGNVENKRLYGGRRKHTYVAASQGGTMTEILSAVTAMRLATGRNMHRWISLLREYDEHGELRTLGQTF